MITLVTMATAQKTYGLAECLKAWDGLERPEGEPVRILLVTDGTTDLDGLSFFPEEVPPIDPSLPVALRAAHLRQGAVEWLRTAGHLGRFVLWVDNDVLLEPDTLLRFLEADAALSKLCDGPRVLSGVMPFRKSEAPLVFPQPFVSGFEPKVVDGFGFGCVFMPATLATRIGWKAYLERNDAGVGEDLWWCEQARAAGAALWAIPTVRPWHLDETGIAGQSTWDEDGTWSSRVRMVLEMARKTYDGKRVLLSSIEGHSHRLGDLMPGQPVTHWADGRQISDEEMLELAAGSQHLTIHDPTPEPEDVPAKD